MNIKTGRGGKKVSIIGAGNVGATLAQWILEHNLADVILVDIDEGIGKGKAFDLEDASSIMGYERSIEGTSDFSNIINSDIIVLTAGFSRRPGMSREELLQKNSSIVKDISLKIKEFAPKSIIIVVTNPLDVMSYLAYKVTGFDKSRVMGMAGVLDAARCSNLVAKELNVISSEVDSVVIGSHDNNMMPLTEYSTAQGKSFKTIFSQAQRNDIAERTKTRGAAIVALLKSGSAFFAPAAACFSMVKTIINNERLTLCASVYIDGEYGLSDIFIGAPAVIGKKGVEKIVELKLADDEALKLRLAAESVKSAVLKLTY